MRLIKIQYKAMGQAAKIISNHNNGKKVRLHVSMIGASAFNNPIKETVPAAIEALKEGLKGVKATVILHSRDGCEDRDGKFIFNKGNTWKDNYLNANKTEYTELLFGSKTLP